MASDLSKKNYYTIDETLTYIHGSAEVIGLMMARIINLSEQSYQGAKMLGRAMQQINFIRDIKEDINLGRQYLPIDEMNSQGLKSLSKDLAHKQPREYVAFINKQLDYYNKWQKEAESYFNLIPSRYRLPIQTAAAMYKYTAKKIAKNPFSIFDTKIRPSIITIILSGFKQFFLILCSKLF